MANTFKTFLNDDIVSTRTLLHEAVPITGAIASGTYNDENIKNYSHQLFQSVYDFPYLSSSANHIFDLTVGYNEDSQFSGSTSVQNAQKINMYYQMAQVLVGHDENGAILKFDEDGDIAAGGQKLNDVFFVNFARLLTKDEIKKGSFQMILGTGTTYANPFAIQLTLTDAGAQNNYRVNSPAGEYAVLYDDASDPKGLLYYQAGIAVLTSSLFSGVDLNAATEQLEPILENYTIDTAADAFRHRLFDLSFNNTTELNSTIHFCRVNNNDFNYSSNPTYLDSDGKMFVKNSTLDAPVTYITTVGLYSADNELLAVAKLSEPLKKDPTNEIILRVRLDY